MSGMNRWLMSCALLLSCATISLPSCAAVADHEVEIRRTTDGVPHIRAANWRDLGFGYGYVQAQDALCTMAEAFVTYQGQRAYFFGADARPKDNSTFGRAKNIDMDFFFRGVADESVISSYRAAQTLELNQLVDGFAGGYNRYIHEQRDKEINPSHSVHGVGVASHSDCISAEWVRDITPDDIYRRLFAANIAAGYTRFVSEIANAHPPGVLPTLAPQVKAGQPLNADTLADRLKNRIGEQPGLGSNMLAFGEQATGEKSSVLFGNPHWYWGGPDRFYQAQLTIPGKLNVAGVSFLGVPVIMIGFNDHIAWSHTVSDARRFGLFSLTLDPDHADHYMVDGQSVAMKQTVVTVDVRDADGAKHAVTRTLYRTRFGPLVDLGGRNPAFGWNQHSALAIRDINEGNFRVFRNFMDWNQAKSLDAFVAIQKLEVAMPWTNTSAIGRDDGRVWYGDIGAVPYVTDALRTRCATPLAQGFSRIDPVTPVLDGSRSDCDWQTDAESPQSGAMPISNLPGLFRRDYVANMNDSYWLTNPHAPLEGFAKVLGGERIALSLRGRYGHALAGALVQDGFHSSQALAGQLMQNVLDPHAYSADRFKDELLSSICTASLPAHTRQVDLQPACRILRQWSNTANPDDRGAILWDFFWKNLMAIPASAFYRIPFSPAAPLTTPRAPNADDPRVAQALLDAVATMQKKGIALDAPLGSLHYVMSNGKRIPLYGGCAAAGYFTVSCNAGDYQMNPMAEGNTYLQVVRFDRQGVVAHTLLAHGEQESAVAGGAGSEPVMRYAQKNWLPFSFRESDIAADPALERFILRP